jgi:hypothetical protein
MSTWTFARLRPISPAAIRAWRGVRSGPGAGSVLPSAGVLSHISAVSVWNTRSPDSASTASAPPLLVSPSLTPVPVRPKSIFWSSELFAASGVFTTSIEE